VTEIVHTRNREETARELLRRYGRVLVRNKNNLWNPLRLRRAALADLNPFIVLNPQEFDTQLAAWNREGGLCIYDRAYVALENIAAHPAQLISECPISIPQLDAWTEGTSEIAVVYRPPNWNEHRRWVRSNFPRAEQCRRLYDFIAAAPACPEVAAAVGMRLTAPVVAERQAQAYMGMRSAELGCARRAMLPPRAFKMVWQVSPRIAPLGEPTLSAAYAFLDECPQLEGARLVVPAEISKRVRHWKVAMRLLERRGHVAVRDTLFCYDLDEIVPHWERLDARQRTADTRLEEIIARVEASAEFNPQALPTPRLPAHPARTRLSSVAA